MTKWIGLATVMLAASSLQAASVLDFEGLQNLEGVGGYYSGGTGSLGSGPGPNFGITFNGSTLALIDSDSGGTGNIANEPSGQTVLVFLDSTAIMNVAAGFDTGFSFFYAAVAFPGTVTVYDGLNATGNILASLNLPANGQSCGGDPSGQYNCWDPVGVLFAGTALSVDFSGTANFIVYDDITLGSEIPGGSTDVPEPSSVALALIGMAGIWTARRYRLS